MQGCISGRNLTTFCVKGNLPVVQLWFLYQVNYNYPFLDLQLSCAKHVVYHLEAYNSNHSWYWNSNFIRTIMFHNTVTTMLELVKFLTIRERRRFESISTSWEFIPNTNLGLPATVALGHLLCNLGTYFAGSISTAQLGTTSYLDNQDYPALGLMSGSPHILTTIQSAHFDRTRPSWATRLRSWNELFI